MKVLMKNNVQSNHGRLADENVYELPDDLAAEYISQGLAEAAPAAKEVTPTTAQIKKADEEKPRPGKAKKAKKAKKA